jgi:hypothetical protein
MVYSTEGMNGKRGDEGNERQRKREEKLTTPNEATA